MHEAKVVPDSVKAAHGGGISFQVICCDNPETIERHTIHRAHMVPDEDLELMMEHRVTQHEEKHERQSGRVAHIKERATAIRSKKFLAAQAAGLQPATPNPPEEDITECEGCK